MNTKKSSETVTTPCSVYKISYRISICKLSTPAKCEFRIDGKMALVNLCGGNGLFDDVKQCPYRVVAEITELSTVPTEGVKV